ncbi:hypothetical protein Mic7113_6693 (plasmid) [Allocoleopsis franciscana PCC 7113]|uniref:Uncharacterized protein n=1 Tax=Allocoleopsis franciscana PCC 7113 TaxID=1173027 RepID=K9WRS7_9CYAN|nr:hypothetical protein Mic7113_6693 [Allocoleopsis franciscana PCC 7113]
MPLYQLALISRRLLLLRLEQFSASIEYSKGTEALAPTENVYSTRVENR